MQDHAFAVRTGSVESTQLRLCAGYSAGTYPFDKSVEELQRNATSATIRSYQYY